MKKSLLILLLFIPIFMFSQNSGFELLKKINGIEVYYKMSRSKETEKKDIWLIEYEYLNVAGKDKYYKTTEVQASDLDVFFGKRDLTYSNFATLSVENSQKAVVLNGGNGFLTGDKSRLTTEKSESIYVFRKDKTYTNSFQLRCPSDFQPIVSVKIINSILFTENILDFL